MSKSHKQKDDFLQRHRIELSFAFFLGVVSTVLFWIGIQLWDLNISSPQSVQAAGSSVLTLSPTSGSATVGQIFPVDVVLNTASSQIVAVSAYVRFDQTRLQVASVDPSSSMFTYEVENTTDTTIGRVMITRAIPTPGVSGSALHIARINFRGIAPVTSSVVTIEFTGADASGDSGVILDDGLGTDTLNSVFNGSYTITAPICTENWNCTNWSGCTNGVRTRTCTDQFSCGTTISKPLEQQTCSLSVCTENWTCSAWSSCSGGTQSRTCSDQAQCGTQTDRPLMSRSCSSDSTSDTIDPNTKILKAPLRSVRTRAVLVEWTGQDDQTAVSDLQFSYRLDRGPWSAFQRVTSYSFSGLYSGGHTIEVRSRDLGGNVDLSPAIVYLIVAPDSGISVAPSTGGGPQIRLFQSNGRVVRQFFAYETSFRGGVSVASGDLGDDGVREIVTAPGPGRAPEVRLFRMNGSRITQFLAYARSFRGGVDVDLADVNGDGRKEIITTPLTGSPQMKVFTFRNNRWELMVPTFLTYASTMQSGVNLASGDFDGDGKDEVATVPARAGNTTTLRIFGLRNGRMQLLTPQMTALTSRFRGGANIAAGDLNLDGKDEIVVSVGSGGGPQVQVFGINRTGRYSLVNPGFFAFDQTMRTGVDVGVVDTDGDGRSEIIASTVGRHAPLVRIFSSDGRTRIREFRGFPGTIFPGVRVNSW